MLLQTTHHFQTYASARQQLRAASHLSGQTRRMRMAASWMARASATSSIVPIKGASGQAGPPPGPSGCIMSARHLLPAYCTASLCGKRASAAGPASSQPAACASALTDGPGLSASAASAPRQARQQRSSAEPGQRSAATTASRPSAEMRLQRAARVCSVMRNTPMRRQASVCRFPDAAWRCIAATSAVPKALSSQTRSICARASACAGTARERASSTDERSSAHSTASLLWQRSATTKASSSGAAASPAAATKAGASSGCLSRSSAARRARS